MSGLKEFQESFQRAVVEGDDAILAEITDTKKEKRDVLLGVYRNAYVLRLIEFLQNDYEKLHALLGDDQFDDLARGYVAACPSDTPNARWYGQKLPEFLSEQELYKNTPALADLAGLERALNDAFDAPDAPALSMDDLAALAPEDWAALTFSAHPAVTCLEVTTNAADIWRALNEDKEPPAAALLPQPAQIAVCRSGGVATFRPLAGEEAMMWNEAAQGVAFSVLCEMLATYGGEQDAALRAASYLRGWIESEMLAAPAA